jgi:hypothetical protein
MHVVVQENTVAYHAGYMYLEEMVQHFQHSWLLLMWRNFGVEEFGYQQQIILLIPNYKAANASGELHMPSQYFLDYIFQTLN